jgi:hypothetical protein
VIKKRPTWSCDTLEDENNMHLYGSDDPYHEEEQMVPPIVRQGAPPSIISEGT